MIMGGEYEKTGYRGKKQATATIETNDFLICDV
jgi:hypothetical protein